MNKFDLARFKIQKTRKIYIHNDLDNAAFYLKEVLAKKLADGTRDAIMFDAMACATICAFTFEAYLNFFGSKKVNGWKERQPFDTKKEQVFAALGITPDWTQRPYASIEELRKLRDTLAHGKPHEEEIEMTVDAKVGELETRAANLSGAWEKWCQPERVIQCYEDLEIIWKQMLEASKIGLFETMTHGEGGITLIKKLEQPKEAATAR